MKDRVTSAEFKQAIKRSLDELVERGLRVSQASVIENAKTVDGRSVGKVTLYRRHDKSKELVHKDLIEAIEIAKNNALKKTGKRTPKETMASLRRVCAEQVREIQGLTDKVVEQELKIADLERDTKIENVTEKALESELYIMQLLFLKRFPKVGDFTSLVSAFELRYKNTEHLEQLKKRVSQLDADIQYSTILMGEFHKTAKF